MSEVRATPPPDVFQDGLEGISSTAKRAAPKNQNNNYSASYIPVNTHNTDLQAPPALRGRKTFAFWTLVGLLFVLAVGNLVLTMTILGVLKLGQGMQSLELVPEYSAIKLFGNTDLNDIYKRDGRLESYMDHPIQIDGIDAPLVFNLTNKYGRTVQKLEMSKNGTIINNTNNFLVKDDEENEIFTTNAPSFNVPHAMRKLNTTTIHTNRIVAPLKDDLLLEGKSVHVRGSEGTTLEGRDLVITADRDIYIKSLNGSIVLVGKDGVRLDHKKLPIFLPKINDKLTMQYKVCVCMPQGKLFKIPVTRDNARVYCDRINMQQFNPCI
ncbi:beta-sarcoglycan [Atheta coriaria]|uniref:beta-sarcoglycan n=1 Tax=Dalotia coriaria TaxID=877792 RepID=UPI0031F339AF